MPKCPECKALYGTGDDFCPKCGKRVTKKKEKDVSEGVKKGLIKKEFMTKTRSIFNFLSLVLSIIIGLATKSWIVFIVILIGTQLLVLWWYYRSKKLVFFFLGFFLFILLMFLIVFLSFKFG